MLSYVYMEGMTWIWSSTCLTLENIRFATFWTKATCCILAWAESILKRGIISELHHAPLSLQSNSLQTRTGPQTNPIHLNRIEACTHLEAHVDVKTIFLHITSWWSIKISIQHVHSDAGHRRTSHCSHHAVGWFFRAVARWHTPSCCMT